MKIELLLVSCALFALMGCSKDGNPLDSRGGCGDGNWYENVENEISNLSLSASQYANDPSSGNCASYKDALNNYLDALEGIRRCVQPAQQTEFNQAIDGAREDVEEIDCGQS